MKEISQLMLSQKEIGLKYLFVTFFRVGVSAFGGHMGLLSVVEKLMVERDKVLDHQEFLDTISIASMLPGPMAVNVVSNIGYRFRGSLGLLISMVSVLLPACFLMFILAWAYYRFAFVFQAQTVLVYVSGAICAIIFSAGYNLAIKELRQNKTKIFLSLLAFVLILLISHYAITVVLMVIGAIIGVGRNLGHTRPEEFSTSKFNFSLDKISKSILGVFLLIEIFYVTNAQQFLSNIYLKLALIFSGTSLTLFGGGYVMIPIMQTLYVNELGWLTNVEFVDVIAFTQITPGPILVSATFIGYKMGGILGGLIATAAIFLPSALLMVIVSKMVVKNKGNSAVRSALEGVRAIVVGMILASALQILAVTGLDYIPVLTAVAAFLLMRIFQANPIHIIAMALFLGVIVEKILPTFL